MTRRTKLSEQQKTRLANFTRLVDGRLGGSKSAAARTIKRSHTFVWQLLNARRGLGERSARLIEQGFALVPHALDDDGITRTSWQTARLDPEAAELVRLFQMMRLPDQGTLLRFADWLSRT